MVKIILFDIYGMVIQREMRFSQRFSKDFNFPIEKMLSFFQNEFQLCLIGNADLKKELKKVKNDWGWEGSVEELLKYWIEYDKKIDQRITDSVKKLRDSGIKCFLNTQNEKYSVQYAFEGLGLKKYFEGIFSTDKIGYIKSEQGYWEGVWQLLGSPEKQDVLCWDDVEKNIEAAKKFGFSAELYTDFDGYNNKIKNYLK